jgi:hypothetical protein
VSVEDQGCPYGERTWKRSLQSNTAVSLSIFDLCIIYGLPHLGINKQSSEYSVFDYSFSDFYATREGKYGAKCGIAKQ